MAMADNDPARIFPKGVDRPNIHGKTESNQEDNLIDPEPLP